MKSDLFALIFFVGSYLDLAVEATHRLTGIFEDSHRFCQHDHGLIPYFGNEFQNESTVQVFQGSSAVLSCTVHNLAHRLVTWIRKTNDDLQLLTIGQVSHTSDPRIEPEHLYPHHWILRIDPVAEEDSGQYLCQVSSDPPIVQKFQLTVKVPTPSIRLADSEGKDIISDLFYDSGSNIELHCQVRPLWTKSLTFIWLKSGRPFDLDIWRGGIGLRKELLRDGIASIINIANTSIEDTGNYSCAAGNLQASVMIHVLKGENRAAMQHAFNGKSLNLPDFYQLWLLNPLLSALITFFGT